MQGVDGSVHVKGDSWGFGYQLGVLYEATARTRVGLSYRSMVHHEFEGPAEFTVPPKASILQSTGALTATGSALVLDLPEVVRFAVYHEIDARWAVMGGVTWTNWSRFGEVMIRFDNPAQPALMQPEEWHDAWRYALGVARCFGPRWIVQLGTAYDQTPVPSAALRTPRIPDSDRVWITGGIGYRATERLRLDLSYAHFFGFETSTSNHDPVTGHVLRGRRRAGERDGILVEQRAVEGSSFLEVRASGRSSLPPAAIAETVWNHRDYIRFVPYLERLDILAEGPDWKLVYEQVAMPLLVSDRDYTLRLQRRAFPETGRFEVRFAAAPAEGPPESEQHVRVRSIEGSWVR